MYLCRKESFITFNFSFFLIAIQQNATCYDSKACEQTLSVENSWYTFTELSLRRKCFVVFWDFFNWGYFGPHSLHICALGNRLRNNSSSPSDLYCLGRLLYCSVRVDLHHHRQSWRKAIKPTILATEEYFTVLFPKEICRTIEWSPDGIVIWSLLTDFLVQQMLWLRETILSL